MRKRLVTSIDEYNKVVSEEINLDKSVVRVPREFPCLVIIGYLGAGWDELSIIYKDDFSA